MIHLIKQILKLLQKQKRQNGKLTANQVNDLEVYRKLLKQELEKFNLNEFIKFLKQQQIEEEELEKILQKQKEDIDILLSICIAITAQNFEKFLDEYLKTEHKKNKKFDIK